MEIKLFLTQNKIDPECIAIFEYLNNVRMESDQGIRQKETISLFVNYIIDKSIKGEHITLEKLIAIIFLLVVNH